MTSKKLNDYLRQNIEDSCKKLQEITTLCEKEECWRNLAEYALAKVILFNRRHQGEVSRMTVDEYNKKMSIAQNCDAPEALSAVEKSLCKIVHTC